MQVSNIDGEVESNINPDELPDVADDDAPGLPDDLPTYDNCLVTDDYVPPPSLPAPPDNFQKTIQDASAWNNAGKMSEDDAMEALRIHIKKNCCWGKGPAEKMKINSIEPTTAYKYCMNSYCERRKVEWKDKPYKHGGVIDGPFNGPAPGTWQIFQQRPEDFKNETFYHTVPHTEQVRKCGKCRGYCVIKCTKCLKHFPNAGGPHGQWKPMGGIDCPSCHQGKKDGEQCGRCQGRGWLLCTSCHGKKYKACPKCDATGKLIHYLELKIDFKDHDDNYIHEVTNLPDELIMGATGETLMNEKAFRIGPIINFHVREINEKSRILIEEHAAKCLNEVMHMQKHRLESIPVNQVNYEIDGEKGVFFVYGNEHFVFSHDYPAQCCGSFNLPGCCNNCACCNSCSLM
jgi:hypothetical protein